MDDDFDKVSFYIRQITESFQNLSCNGFELKEFFEDKDSTLIELNSKDTPISSGESINIILKNLDSKFLINKTIQEIGKEMPKDLTDDTKSISTLSNISNLSNMEVTCFVKIISDFVPFKTNFHQFAVGSKDTFSNLLDNLLQYHTKQNFVTKEQSLLLMKSEWIITIHCNERCSPIDKTIVNLSDSRASIKT